MQINFFSVVIRALMLMTLSSLIGCGEQSDKDANSQSQTSVGSAQLNKAGAENISVRIVAVLQRPATQLSWVNERGMLQLAPEEKKAIASNGITGQLEVVYSQGRGSGSREVRVIIIQSSPLKENALLPVPENGSAIYFEKEGALKALSTNFPASSFTLEIYQEKRDTTFFMNNSRDGVREGGSVFWWDENGKWHAL